VQLTLTTDRCRAARCRKHASRRAANAQALASPAHRALWLVSVGIGTTGTENRVGLSIFLSVDPIAGGSANSYDYSWQDPINNRDLGGRTTAVGGNTPAWYQSFWQTELTWILNATPTQLDALETFLPGFTSLIYEWLDTGQVTIYQKTWLPTPDDSSFGYLETYSQSWEWTNFGGVLDVEPTTEAVVDDEPLTSAELGDIGPSLDSLTEPEPTPASSGGDGGGGDEGGGGGYCGDCEGPIPPGD
jgi:hypothetical protein